VRAFPLAGRILVGLGQRRVNVDGAENLVQAKAMAHRQHVFGDQVAGVFTDDGYAEDTILARHRQHLDEAVRLAVGDRAIEIVDALAGHFVVDTLLLRIALVEADARYLGLGEGCPGNHRVIDLEAT
jgi:hypothetical protein